MKHPIFFKGRRHWHFLGFCLLCLILVSGCAGRSGSSADLSDDLDPEEIAPLPYLPADDGTQLSRNELVAMSYKSDFIKRLSMKDEQEVLLHFKYFTHRGRANFERYLLRAERYLPYVERVFREKGIPSDVAFLAVVESGFNPNAVSCAGATGLWQFMPGTGDIYGLERGWWIDERRDPYKATEAAANYLTKLYGDFGDWYLAIAAYNAGEGKIGRALSGTGAEDFFELCNLNDRLDSKARLKEETRQYVPKFIAVARIMHNLERLGFNKLDFSKWQEPEHIVVEGGTDLRGLADATGLSWEDFVEMNPAPQRQATAPNSRVTVHLPKTVTDRAVAYLKTEKSRSFAGWTPYKVKKGDTISKISKMAGVPVKEISKVNKLNPKKLRVGQTLLLPGSAQRNIQTASSKGGSRSVAPGSAYTIKSGDTLYSIALDGKTSVKSLCAANNITEQSKLQVGQKLTIPGASSGSGRSGSAQAPAKVKPLAAKGNYTVKSGDTMWSIARDLNVSPVALLELNKMTKENTLKVGQKIKIP